MNIHDAVAEALKKNAYIRRSGLIWSACLIKPTNSYNCCIIFCIGGCSPFKWWNPKAEDLMADDWEVVTGIGGLRD